MIWAAGVLAAVRLGAVAPVSSVLRDETGLSLATVAWATSGMTAVSAVLGVPAGWWILRVGARRAVCAGLVVIASAGFGGALLAGVWPGLLTARVVEGFGYLLVFVGGPIAVTRTTSGHTRSVALALWGTCIPVGLAVASGLGGAVAPDLGVRGWLAVTALAPLSLAPAVALLLPRLTPAPPTPNPRPTAVSWQGPLTLAVAFACVSLIAVAVVVLLPTYLTEQRDVSSAAGGAATAAVSLSSAVGSLLAGWALRRGATLARMVPLAAVMPVAVLLTFSAAVPTAVGTVLACCALAVNGLLVSAMFAAVPGVCRRSRDVEVANGLVAQTGSLGTFLGPPAFGAAVTGVGWPGMALATLAFTTAGATLLWRSLRTDRTPGLQQHQHQRRQQDTPRPTPGGVHEDRR
ncbi:CynX/NimT family MFS transporter [Streptomyces sp. NPDC017941]|uniref:CynX/NimT family MFS transporter n=1 Tax=Streptomyces sp. NPDC017941 TaxID=3365018 RepID=UPI00378ABB89